MVPYCIQHYPNVVLEVVLSTTIKHVHVDSTMSTPLTPVLASTEDKVVEDLRLTPPLGDTAISDITASKYGKNKITPMISKPEFESTVLHKLDGLHNQGGMTQRIAQE
ncbi:hypothetical protein BGZ58_006879, partial [Dissophora ornata]